MLFKVPGLENKECKHGGDSLEIQNILISFTLAVVK